MAVKISSYHNRVKTGLPGNAEELGQGCRTAVLHLTVTRLLQSVHTMDIIKGQ